ncbi:MAG: sel1 repeat family protein, partial [Xanthobacteraceae bacterium]
MNAQGSSLLGRHAGLWLNDPWYRLAWTVWPQLVSVLCAGWILIGPPQVREAAAPWAKPVAALASQYDALRDQAETDPSALDRLTQMANAGDATAQFSMATLYDPDFKLGKITAPDMNIAIAWYEKAAENGQVIAEENLGIKYYEGRWVAADYAKATFW